MLTGNASIVQPSSFRSIFKGRKVIALRPGNKTARFYASKPWMLWPHPVLVGIWLAVVLSPAGRVGSQSGIRMSMGTLLSWFVLGARCGEVDCSLAATAS